jgi:hypothetical protein
VRAVSSACSQINAANSRYIDRLQQFFSCSLSHSFLLHLQQITWSFACCLRMNLCTTTPVYSIAHRECMLRLRIKRESPSHTSWIHASHHHIQMTLREEVVHEGPWLPNDTRTDTVDLDTFSQNSHFSACINFPCNPGSGDRTGVSSSFVTDKNLPDRRELE